MDTIQKALVEFTHHKIHEALNGLSPYLPSSFELTLIARVPGNDDAEMFVSNCDIDDLIGTLERFKKRMKEQDG